MDHVELTSFSNYYNNDDDDNSNSCTSINSNDTESTLRLFTNSSLYHKHRYSYGQGTIMCNHVLYIKHIMCNILCAILFKGTA